MNITKGQRWMWSEYGKRKLILEVIGINNNIIRCKTVQVLLYGSEFRLTDELSWTSMPVAENPDARPENWEYLEGQDK